MRLSVSVSLWSLAITHVLGIWPAPLSIETGTSTLWVGPGVAVSYNGEPLFDASGNYPAGVEYQSKQLIQQAVTRAWKAILEDNFVPWKLHPRNELSKLEPDVNGQNNSITKLEITQTAKDTESTFKPLAGEVDESYNLTIGTDGVAKISAVSSVGVLHSLESFVQLFYKHSSGKAVYTNLAPVAIQDAPKFPHRGVLLDTSRNWFPINNIYRTIDALAYNKLNKLHLHITDSQSWPLEIPSIPELAKNGAYAPNLWYTPTDIQKLQKYAVERGVQVIVEIDTPGHIATVAHSFPELITAFNQEPWNLFCAQPPCGQLKLNDSRVDPFLDRLMDDLLPRLSPYTAYFHTGGDEIHVNDSLVDPTIKSNDPLVIQPYLQSFIDKHHARVRKAGLAPFVWEEIPSEWNVTLGKDVVVQTWLGGSAVKELTGKGHKVIDTDYNFWYLDCGRGQWLNFENGPTFNTYYPFNDWCGPTKSWRLIYSHNPVANLTAEEAKLVLGGEAAVWSETIDEENLDSIIWPRGSALAEVLWSGNTDASGNNRSQVEASPRLSDFRERLVARGIGASPVQLVFCTQGNGTTCEYPS